MTLALLGCSYHLHPRPHLLTILLVGWTHSRLADFEAGQIALGRLFWLVPLYLLWANVHGGMVGGVGCLAVAGLGWWLTAFVRDSAPLKGGHYVLYTGLVLLCALAALLNPYGAELPRVWFSLMSSPLLPRLIQEHGPLRDSGMVAWVVVVQAALYVGALLSISPRRWQVSWLLPLPWLVLTWTRIRYGPLFAVTATIALAEAYPHFRWTGWLARQGSVVFRPRPPAHRPGLRALAVPAVLVASALVLQATAVTVPILGSGWARLNSAHLPVELLPQLWEYERTHPEGTPIFNDMLFGGFLIYQTPRLRVFIDDRCELYGNEGLLEYSHAYVDAPEQIDRWQGQYAFDAALVQTGTRFDRHLRNAAAWTLVGQTKSAALFRRLKQ
jgi:hypothetical protein